MILGQGLKREHRGPRCRYLQNVQDTVFEVLSSRCLTGSALLDCHVLKGFGIYMIGILDSLSDVWKASTGTPPCKLLRVNTLR